MSTRRAVVYSLANDMPRGPMPVGEALASVRPAARAVRRRSRAARRRSRAIAASCSRWQGGSTRRASASAGRRPILDEAGVESLSWGSLGSASYAKLLTGDRGRCTAGDRRRSGTPTRSRTGRRRGWRSAPHSSSRASTATRAAGRRPSSASPRTARRSPARIPPGCPPRHGSRHITAGSRRRSSSLERAVERVERQRHAQRPRESGGLSLAEVQRAAGLDAEADASVEQAIRLFEQKGNVAAIALVREAACTPGCFDRAVSAATADPPVVAAT